jgi:acetyl-CoA C-acetyltransferase
MNPSRIPVIIGVGQINDRENTLDTLELMQAALRRAEQDTGASVLAQLQFLGVEDQMSWHVTAWPAREKITPYLLETLQITPKFTQTTAMPSGDGPVQLLNDAANRIGAGEVELAAIVGAEALRTAAARAAQTRMEKLSVMRGSAAKHGKPCLRKYGLLTPTDVYPLYESATRAAWGQTLAEAQSESSALWSQFSAAAAENPHAWIQKFHTPEEITTVTPENRVIAFPYTKRMVANSSVNMGAALIIASLEKARALSVPEERMIYIGAGAAAHEDEDFLRRDSYAHSASMEVVLTQSLALNALRVEDLDYVELYSCFPCIPKMARRILRWPAEKNPSVYGGLTFGGGPIGNCMMHAAAAMVEKLRVRGTNGFIFANGGFATHNHGIVLTRQQPRVNPFPQDYHLQAQADAQRGNVPPLIEEYAGPGTIEAYTVPYARDGKPQFATIIARAPGGARFLAKVPGDDEATLACLTSGALEPVGTQGNAVQHGDVAIWRRA